MVNRVLNFNRNILVSLVAVIMFMGISIVYAGGGGGGAGGGGGFGTSEAFGATNSAFGCGNDDGGGSYGGGGAAGRATSGGGSYNPPAPIPPPTASITCEPSTVDNGEPAIISWSCGGGATSSSGEGFSTGDYVSGHLSVFPVQESTYTVTCSKTSGSVKTASKSCTIGVNEFIDPEGDNTGDSDPEEDNLGSGNGSSSGSGGGINDSSWLECFPRNITGGESIRIKWNCADSIHSTLRDVTSSSDLHAGTPGSGQIIVQLDANNEYKLTCNDDSYVSSCNINVSADPSVDIQATPLLLHSGSQARITWSSIAATGCTISGPDLSSTAFAGSELITILGESIYTIECDDNLSDSVTVNVIPTWNEQ